ncbi:MAG: hypothetical protein HYX63_12540 [Gammaproteobacteria bacterium]|nr:hypothetical protein [Gammaproteobacteria bacterium]
MTDNGEVALSAQRLLLRGQLHAQRQRIAEQLAPTTAEARGRYPRSVTMRLLNRRPVALLARSVALVAGARLAGSVTGILVLVNLLRSAIAVKARKPAASPHSKS